MLFFVFFLTDAEEAYELTTLENDDLQDRQWKYL